MTAAATATTSQATLTVEAIRCAEWRTTGQAVRFVTPGGQGELITNRFGDAICAAESR